MLAFFVVEFSATPILNRSRVQDFKIGMRRPIFWFDFDVFSEIITLQNTTSFRFKRLIDRHYIFNSVFLRAFSLSHHFIKNCRIENIVNNNESQWRGWSWRKLCPRRVTIPTKTPKSNKTINPRRVAFDILNVAATQSWRGGENWREETRVLSRVVKLCAAGNCLWVCVLQDAGVQQHLSLLKIIYFFNIEDL